VRQEGKREGGEGGKEGRREGGKEGRREGGRRSGGDKENRHNKHPQVLAPVRTPEEEVSFKHTGVGFQTRQDQRIHSSLSQSPEASKISLTPLR
jgi:hypothetical protein